VRPWILSLASHKKEFKKKIGAGSTYRQIRIPVSQLAEEA
jgi:hypothetical protein